jgi:hypothetical protein
MWPIFQWCFLEFFFFIESISSSRAFIWLGFLRGPCFKLVMKGCKNRLVFAGLNFRLALVLNGGVGFSWARSNFGFIGSAG